MASLESNDPGGSMKVFTFHLARVHPATSLRALARQPGSTSIPGLVHAEWMIAMRLGAPISPARFQLRTLALFAAWEGEAAIDRFLETDSLGARLANGWHVRMDFIRRWGHISQLAGLPTQVGEQDPEAPTVAVTLARLKHAQIPRFIKWGKPVEELVRDDPNKTLALAATHPVRTVSTFSVWRSQRDMTNMVHGHSHMVDPRRHADAMIERKRKDFHFEFTTLRFRPRSEHGTWDSRTGFTTASAAAPSPNPAKHPAKPEEQPIGDALRPDAAAPTGAPK